MSSKIHCSFRYTELHLFKKTYHMLIGSSVFICRICLVFLKRDSSANMLYQTLKKSCYLLSCLWLLHFLLAPNVSCVMAHPIMWAGSDAYLVCLNFPCLLSVFHNLSLQTAILKEEVLLMHLPTGRAHLMHGHLLQSDPAPVCVHCGLFHMIWYTFGIPTLWERSLYILSSRHIAQYPQRNCPMFWHFFIVQGLTSLFNHFHFKSSPSHHRLIILNWPNYLSFHWTFVIRILIVLVLSYLIHGFI